MEIIEGIKTRRSIRKFKGQAVSPELIRQLLEAAMSAPSAGNQQPWHFVVIDQRRILDQVPTIHPYAAFCKQAPLAILVCGDPRLEKYPGFWVQDCSAATQNLLLAAHGTGLGAVWTGVYPVDERVQAFRKLLDLPEEVIPLALVVIGHPDQKRAHPERYLQERVHHNAW